MENSLPFQHDHLLIQFFLDEFLVACPLIRSLRTVREKLEGAFGEIQEEAITELSKEVKALVFESDEWSMKEGPLRRLKKYAVRFNDTVRRAANKAFYASLQVLEELSFKEKREVLYPHLDQMQEGFAIIAEEVPTLIAKFNENENVLYFLLKNRDELDEIYEPSFIRELCDEIFDGGVDEMAGYIVKKYRERGFGLHVPDIESRIAFLESLAV